MTAPTASLSRTAATSAGSRERPWWWHLGRRITGGSLPGRMPLPSIAPARRTADGRQCDDAVDTGAPVLLVEFSEAHAECLYAQCRFLADAGCAVHLLVHPRLLPRVSGFPARCQALPPAADGFRGGWVRQRAVARYAREHRIRHVVVNTASGWAYRLLALRPAMGRRLVAIVHDIDRLRRSFCQRLTARRLATVLVLAERLEDPCRELGVGRVDSFYPAWFPSRPAGFPETKPAGELWFAVVGQIETKRRCYEHLIAAAAAGLDARIRIFVLGAAIGDEGRAVVTQLRASVSAGRLTIRDGFVDDDALHGILARCDGMLPLIEDRQRYLRSAVSGSFNLAYGYRLPLLLAAPIDGLSDEISRCTLVAERGEGLAGLLCRIADDPAPLVAMIASMHADEGLSFARHQRRYLDAVIG